MPIRPLTITTERLILRPTRPSDAVCAVAIRSAWEVSRNLSRASFPREIARWFADHGREWPSGEAYRFAIECDGAMIGVIDLDGFARGEAHLGYWLDPAAWGRGYASEAGAALVRFADSEVGLTVLRAGHASDNPASGRVLTKLGFLPRAAWRPFSRNRAAKRSCSATMSCDRDRPMPARTVPTGRAGHGCPPSAGCSCRRR